MSDENVHNRNPRRKADECAFTTTVAATKKGKTKWKYNANCDEECEIHWIENGVGEICEWCAPIANSSTSIFVAWNVFKTRLCCDFVSQFIRVFVCWHRQSSFVVWMWVSFKNHFLICVNVGVQMRERTLANSLWQQNWCEQMRSMAYPVHYHAIGIYLHAIQYKI